MTKVKLGVNREIYQRADRQEFGLLRDVIAEFAEDNNIKAECVPVNPKNLATYGKQALFVIREIHKTKKEENKLKSDTIHLGTELSDKLRDREISFSSLLDFPVILHTNQDESATYPLIVSPTVDAVEDENFKNMSITADSEVTIEYKRNVVDIKDILANMQV